MSTTAQANEEPLVRKISTHDPYRLESQRYSAIRERIALIDQQLKDTRAQITYYRLRGTGSDIEERAAEILAGKLEPIPDNRGLNDLLTQRDRLEEEAKALSTAARSQRERLREVITQLSLTECEKMTEPHKAAVMEIAAAIERLSAALDVEVGLHRQIAAAGYDDPLPRFHAPLLRFPMTPADHIDQFLRRAKEYAR